MTGEITLRGNVLPVGGVKEKVLAARRARVSTIILPQQNRRDLDEVPKELFKDIRFVFVDNMRQVFREALKEKVRPPVSSGGGLNVCLKPLRVAMPRIRKPGFERERPAPPARVFCFKLYGIDSLRIK